MEIPISFCTQWQLFIRRLVEHTSNTFPLNFTDHVKFDCGNLISIMLIDILNSLINHGNAMDALYVMGDEGIQKSLCSSAQFSSTQLLGTVRIRSFYRPKFEVMR